jgi:hypothetical protein
MKGLDIIISEATLKLGQGRNKNYTDRASKDCPAEAI